jgi:UDP-N-acetylmuramate dehydrogenase
VLASDAIDAVYVATPHGAHLEPVVACLRAHKAVLCEKPAGLTASEVAQMVGVAGEEHTLFMEAMKARFTPVAERLHQALAPEGDLDLGNLVALDVSFARDLMAHAQPYFYRPVEGGVAKDMGIYAASWVCEYVPGLAAGGALSGLTVREHQVVAREMIDVQVHLQAQVAGVAVNVNVVGDANGDMTARLTFERGVVEVENPHRPTAAVIRRAGQPDFVIDDAYNPTDFSGELAHFEALLAAGAVESDRMSWEDSIACARLVDVMISGYDRYALAEALAASAGEANVLVNEELAPRTTFEIGGPADVLVTPESPSALAACVRQVREAGAPLLLLGKGSDLLVSDAGFHGVVLATQGIDQVEPQGCRLVAQAGAALGTVSEQAAALGLSGLEFACGIPGSVGGAIFMNAGAYGGCMADVVAEVGVLTPSGEQATLTLDELEFGYRTSAVKTRGLTVLWASFDLTPQDPSAIAVAIDDFTRQRKEKQPLELPSAGSTFKRPEGYFAGKLISEAGLQGVSVGGAQVSTKHAGFIVNTGGATAGDVEALIRLVQARVLEKDGVVLEPEVRLIGWF